MKAISSVKGYIHFNKKKDSVNIDNWVFKFHYRLTVWLLVILNAIVCAQEYIGEKIRCASSDPTDSRKALEHVIDTFCFFMTTFTVPRHHNKTSTNREVAHPGVGPAEDDEEIIRHAYYQWVPYVLLLQTIAFYAGHFLWKNWENGFMSKMLKGLNTGRELKRRVQLNQLLRGKSQEENDTVIEDALDVFYDRLFMYKAWYFKYVVCEIYNLINVVFQMWLTDLFLGGKFWNLGTLVYQNYGSNTFNPLDLVFPKVTKCTFKKYGPSGTIQISDVICVLAINVINEKVYLILWYWYIISIIITALNLVHRILAYALYSPTSWYTRKTDSSISKMSGSEEIIIATENIKRELTYPEWFFFLTFGENVDGLLFMNLIKRFNSKILNQNTKEFPDSRNLLGDQKL